MVPESYFVETVLKWDLVPDILKTDCGNENCLLAGIQFKLANNTDAHRYASSISNQRTEHFWSHFKRIYLSWAIDFFKDLADTGSLIIGNFVQMEWLWFVFSPLIQCKLDRLTKEWNAHKIRKCNSVAAGIPDELYFFPESLGYEQCRKNVAVAEVNEVVNESNAHLDFQGIQTTSEPDLVNYSKYLVQASNELFPLPTWEAVKILYQCFIEYAVLVLTLGNINTGWKLKFCQKICSV